MVHIRKKWVSALFRRGICGFSEEKKGKMASPSKKNGREGRRTGQRREEWRTLPCGVRRRTLRQVLERSPQSTRRLCGKRNPALLMAAVCFQAVEHVLPVRFFQQVLFRHANRVFVFFRSFRFSVSPFPCSSPRPFPRIFNPRALKYKDFQSVKSFFLFVNRLAYYLLWSARRNAFIRIADPHIWPRRISNQPKRGSLVRPLIRSLGLKIRGCSSIRIFNP